MEWILSSDRLPPEGMSVLVAVEGGFVSMGVHQSAFGWDWEHFDDEPEDAGVSHWMHTPAHPMPPNLTLDTL